jgi:hypothetical protein
MISERIHMSERLLVSGLVAVDVGAAYHSAFARHDTTVPKTAQQPNSQG